MTSDEKLFISKYVYPKFWLIFWLHTVVWLAFRFPKIEKQNRVFSGFRKKIQSYRWHT
jgi:hypothetical protein